MSAADRLDVLFWVGLAFVFVLLITNDKPKNPTTPPPTTPEHSDDVVERPTFYDWQATDEASA